MFIAGYHGTTLENAKNIIKENSFHLSSSDSEWLGDGIYFYYDINDALCWRSSEAVLHSVVKVEDGEYLDLNSDEGIKIYNSTLRMFCFVLNAKLKDTSDIEMRTCAVMKLIWRENPKLKVLSAAFPTEKTVFSTLIDYRKKRKEFCVRNNEPIVCTQLIKRSDLNG